MKMLISVIAILFSSSFAFAVCPYAKNLQSNSEVDFFDQSSNAYNTKANLPVQHNSNMPGVERRK